MLGKLMDVDSDSDAEGDGALVAEALPLAEEDGRRDKDGVVEELPDGVLEAMCEIVLDGTALIVCEYDGEGVAVSEGEWLMDALEESEPLLLRVGFADTVGGGDCVISSEMLKDGLKLLDGVNEGVRVGNSEGVKDIVGVATIESERLGVLERAADCDIVVLRLGTTETVRLRPTDSDCEILRLLTIEPVEDGTTVKELLSTTDRLVESLSESDFEGVAVSEGE